MEIDVVPVRVHPVKSPVSNPPLVTPAGPMTTRLTVVLWVFAPVPVMVMVYVPPGVLVAVVTDMADEPPLVTEVGLNVAPAPWGRPEALRATVWAVPIVVAVDTVYEVPVPWFTDWLAGEPEMEKSLVGGGVPQLGNLKVAMRVFQLKVPLAGMYSVANQNVQPSTGSTAIAL